MKQIINPADYGKVKRMNMKQLNDYILNMYLAGKRDMRNEILQDSDQSLMLYDNEIRDLLLSIKGINAEMADEFMRKVYELMDEADQI